MTATVKYGLIYGGISVAIPLLLYGLGMDKDDSVRNFSSVINIALPAVTIFLGIREQRETAGNGYISFGKGFSAGMVIALIGGVIGTVFTYLYFTVLNPGMVTYIKMKQEEELIKRGMSDSQVEQMASTMDMWTNPGMMSAFVLLGAILLGLIISLICSAILKKENPHENIG
jgi:hypothetical protein